MREQDGEQVSEDVSDFQLPDEVDPLLEQAERDGCLTRSKVEALVETQELDDEVTAALHEELDRRGSGLGSGEPASIERCADELAVSRDRVRRLERDALEQLSRSRELAEEREAA